MPSEFDSILASVTSEFTAAFGEAITYVAADDSQTPVTADVGAESAQVVDTNDGRFNRRQRIVNIPVSVIPVVETRARLVMKGEAWDVESILAKDAGMTTVRAVIQETLERTHSGYRINRR